MKLFILISTLFMSWALVLSVVQCQEAATVTEASDTIVQDNAAASEPVTDDNNKVQEDVVDPGSNAETAVKEEAAIKEETATKEEKPQADTPPVQAGPLIDLLGPTLLSLEMIDEKSARLQSHLTNDVLRGKKVIGLYFSADWCGPCRQFTPELVSFYTKMNARRGKKDQFEIVWVSRCRDVESFGQYFTHMKWLALPPDEAMGERGQRLSNMYKVKGIPSLVLLDEVGQIITTDARNKIPQDKAGIGFPWRSPFATVLSNILPRSLRVMVKSQVDTLKGKFLQKLKALVGLGKPQQVAA